MKETLLLGQCSSKQDALLKIAAWRPAWAQSYRLLKIRRYRYSVCHPEWFRNYFDVLVEYHSTKTC